MTEPSGAVEAVARAIKAVWDTQSQLEADNSGGAMEYEPGPWQEWEPEARAAIAAMPTPSDQEKRISELEEALACLERALIGSPKYLRARVNTAITLLNRALSPERSPK